MAASQPSTSSVPQDTLITIKISVNDSLKKLKLPLRDLTANVLPDKLRHCLNIKPEQTVVFERFSDSVGGYITLDPNKPQVFKTLIRAAKAKLKLRLKATVSPLETQQREQEQEEVAATITTKEPVIVRTPIYQSPSRESVAIDRRSVGSGIFQFREARASQQTLVNDEAPVPRPFTTNQKSFFDGLAPACSQQTLPLRNRESTTHCPNMCVNDRGHPWSVYCNECDVPMQNAHFHCSICDGGDYDLCEDCVAGGKLCPGEGHWLIKRFIVDGKVVTSTTERVGSKASPRAAVSEEKELPQEMPGAFQDETKTLAEEPRMATRTCNCCVVVLPEQEFVTCQTCDDYDLCIKCHLQNQHGHHPVHGFVPATGATVLPETARMMLTPGRNVRHNAICDGCDKKVCGVRHKCLSCPDWDYCNECIKNAKISHPRHRFAAILTPIADSKAPSQRHYGIYCDGPLCSGKNDQSYIQGVRYKCAVCHDTDFCASCEALPNHHHNRTHPLIKFKTPVRNVSIQTMSEDVQGGVRTLGDQRPASPQPQTKSAGTETAPAAVANAATQVQTVADFQPTEVKSETVQPAASMGSEQKTAPIDIPAADQAVPVTLLNAHFVQDSIPDGMVVQPSARFTQIWTLKNPGPYAWPSGCSVRFVGGDNLLNVDNSRVASATDIADATESNVVGREVQVGEEVAFKVVLKAPVREGKAISYWRLKAADGTPFGHRLWCDVDVKAPAESTLPTAPLFSRMHQGPTAVPLAAQSAQLQMQMQQFQMMRQQQAAMLQQQQQQNRMNPPTHALGQPPAYSPNTHADIATRVAAMRQAQQARREQLMAQFNAQRDQLQAEGIKREDMPSWNHHFNPIIGTTEQQAPGTATNDSEKARKEAAKMRAETIKAKILRAREMKSRAAEEAKAAAEAEKKAAEVKKSEDLEKVKKIIEAASKQDVFSEADSESIESSQMVFPKLEKESPASSTYASASSSTIAGGKGKAAYVENEAGEVERSATPVAPAPEPSIASPSSEKDDFEDLTDDLEVLSADGDESEDDGFLTDEEYDILDASDRETVASP